MCVSSFACFSVPCFFSGWLSLLQMPACSSAKNGSQHGRGRGSARGRGKAKGKQLAQVSSFTRTAEGQAFRSYEKKTKAWDPQDLSVLVNGRIAWEFVCAQVGENRNKAQRMGSHFWTTLRATYQGCSADQPALRVNKPDDILDPALRAEVQAIYSDNNHKRRLTGLLSIICVGTFLSIICVGLF